MSDEFLHTGRDCIEGNPPGTMNAAFVLWATQVDQVGVHSDEFATGTARRVVARFCPWYKEPHGRAREDLRNRKGKCRL